MNRYFEKDKVSVIITVYNTEDYLEECIESVLSQTYNNYEIILVNDGSTDRSENILKSYCNKYSNIYLLNQSNKGLSEARNNGVIHANGEYLYFLDSDDKILEDLLETCVNKFKEKEVDIVHFGYTSFQDTSILKNNLIQCEQDVLSGKEFFKYSSQKFLCRNFETWSYMYRRSFWNENSLKFKEGLIFEDTEIFINIFLKNPRVAIVNRYLYMYRSREESIIRRKKYTINYLKSMNIIINTYFEYINIYKELTPYILKYIRVFYKEKLKILSKIDYLNENTIIEEVSNILHFSEKICIGLEELYLEKLKKLSSRLSLNLEIFDTSYVKEKLTKINDRRYKKISNINLNEQDKLIGIYGVGEHTYELLQYYENTIDNIKSKIILIDSFEKGGLDEKLNLMIINVKDVLKYKFDFIVLSSPYSEEVLLNNLSQYNGVVKRLYNDNNMVLFG